MSTVPDRWIFSSVALNNNAIVTVPAPQLGMVHVVTRIVASIVGDATGNVGGTFTVLDGGGLTIFTWNMKTNAPAATVDRDVFDEDIVLIGTPGQSLQVRFNFNSSFSQLVVTGYTT